MKIGYKVCGTNTHQVTKDFKQDRDAAYKYAREIRDKFNDFATIRIYKWQKSRGKWYQSTFAMDHLGGDCDGGDICYL